MHAAPPTLARIPNPGPEDLAELDESTLPVPALPVSDSLLWMDLVLLIVVPADPCRRRIVELLHGGERSVGELAEAVGVPHPRMSKHLTQLRKAGFVKVRRVGTRHLFSLRGEPLRALEAWKRTYREILDRQLDALLPAAAPPLARAGTLPTYPPGESGAPRGPHEIAPAGAQGAPGPRLLPEQRRASYWTPRTRPPSGSGEPS